MQSALWLASLAVGAAAQVPELECPAMLVLRGVGSAAANQVRPYVDCLNSKIGTPPEILSSCSQVRLTVARAMALGGDVPKVDQALKWLDARIEDRAMCETKLGVDR